MISHLINGAPVESKERFTTSSPASGETLAEVAAGGEAEIDAAVAAAREAFPKWAGLPARERARIMRKFGDLISKYNDEIAALETEDTGLPIDQTSHAMIPRAAENFHFFAEVATHVDGKSYPSAEFLNYTLVQPVGVCGLIVPWNVPFMLATWKVAPCLALGNTAILKPPELAPLTADRLGHIALEAGVPKGVLNVVQGHGRTAGEALVKHEGVRTICFTGGTATGKRITQMAGLKKLSLELGGKSPVLIFDDADLSRALDAALFTIFSINGERCTAGSRIFVQQTVYDKFVADFAARASRLKAGDPREKETKLGSLITKQHLDKVLSYIEIGRKEGAKVLTGGEVPSDLPARVKNGNFLKPTVLADVTNSMRVAQEEIFGPVACLMPFKDEAEALKLANNVRYGLASYIWTQDIGKAHRLAAGIEAGMVFINSQNVRDLRQPFGGVKESGIGREGGDYSFEAFCELKNVSVSLGSNPIPKWGV